MHVFLVSIAIWLMFSCISVALNCVFCLTLHLHKKYSTNYNNYLPEIVFLAITSNLNHAHNIFAMPDP